MYIRLTDGKTVEARLEGEIDHHSVKRIRDGIERELRRTGAVNVLFDLTDVTFMDSSGIGLILGRCKTVGAFGGIVRLRGMNTEIRRLLRMAGLERVTIFEDEKE